MCAFVSSPPVLSTALSFLLTKCSALRMVKAWGVRFVGNSGGGVSVYHPMVLAEARALREAYEKRGVEFAWAGLISQQADGNDSNCPSSIDGDGGVAEGEKDRQRDEREPLEEKSWKPCPFGCGASLESNDIEDHWEVGGCDCPSM